MDFVQRSSSVAAHTPCDGYSIVIGFTEHTVVFDARHGRCWLRCWHRFARYSDLPRAALLLGSGLYYASFVGLVTGVSTLIERGTDVNAQVGRFGNAPQAASEGGHEKVVSILIERGADVNAQGGPYDNALKVASAGASGTCCRCWKGMAHRASL